MRSSEWQTANRLRAPRFAGLEWTRIGANGDGDWGFGPLIALVLQMFFLVGWGKEGVSLGKDGAVLGGRLVGLVGLRGRCSSALSSQPPPGGAPSSATAMPGHGKPPHSGG